MSKRIKTALVALVAGLIPLTGIAVMTASPAQAATGVLSYVTSASTNGARTSHRVVIPNTVNAGDALVMFLTTNSSTATINNTVTGWTLLQQVDGNGIRGRAWTKTATVADRGATVTVTSSASIKSVMSVAAYRSDIGLAEVTASTSSVVNASASSFATPTVPVAEPGSWVVNYWSEKSSAALAWTLPGGVTSRTTSEGTGSGKISAVLGDSTNAVGTAAARTATTVPAASRAALFSVAVTPNETGGGPVNTAPTASFTVTCAVLTCSVDASATTDAQGNPLTYSWNWGDATAVGTGVTATHAYATAGTRTITLTANDGLLNGTTTRTATTTAPPAGPGHTTIVPEIVSTNMPRITTGEIWDLEYIGDRVFVVGGFTSLRNNTANNTTSYNQRFVASFNLSTGLVDANFRPTFDGGVEDIEASPDGTKLYVAGTFNAVNGVTKRKFASINPTTGATVTGFTANGDSAGTELEATNSTVYLGGKFTAINGAAHRGLAAVDANTGALIGRTAANPIGTWLNDIAGGIGPNGELNVQELVLTPDQSTLMVVHTGRQIAGQDRYGVGLIDTASGTLKTWRSHLWEDNLGYVGGIQRAYGGAISPNGQYFVVTSGSGGDRPPINDTAVALPFTNIDNVQPLWISRMFDSVYSVAISEKGVYVGGHFSWQESPTAKDPWPGLDNQGYGTGQGLSGYGLGDDVVRRDHIGVLNPVDGKALEWSPISNSFEGNKAMLVTPRGVVAGGDATTQGGANVGRIAVYALSSIPTSGANETTIINPIEGRVKTTGVEFTIDGTATATSGINRVQLEIIDRDSNQYLQDDLTTWGPANTINANITTPGATSSAWTLPLTIANNRVLRVLAKTYGNNGSSDASKAGKKFETFSVDDASPTASITGPSGIVPTTTFNVTGTAADDNGVRSIGYVIRDGNLYLQDNGTASATYNSFSVAPDVVDATSTTWSTEVTVPYEGVWRIEVTPRDTAGQSSLDEYTRDWIVSSTGIAPSVTITAPVVMNPPTAAAALTVNPGAPVTFTGTATDDENLANVEIQIRNNTTREAWTQDGQWLVNGSAGWFRVTNPVNVNTDSLNWSWTTPFNLSPGAYSFSVRATDDLTLSTATANQGRLTINAQIPGDLPPNALLNTTGTVTGGQVLHLDLAGTATDDFGVGSVRLAIRDGLTNRYLQPNGTLSGLYADLPAVVTPEGGTNVTFSLSVDLPTEGQWNVTALGFDNQGQQDTSTTGATARYDIYPGDVAPVFTENLRLPAGGETFTDARIPVSGRVEDDKQIASVQVAIRNSVGQYMGSTGTFTSTNESWRTAFLNSPGSPGSNYSYTSPVIPAGTYVVRVRATDNHGFTSVPIDSTVTVTVPPNNPPVASFTYTCNQNICGFDAHASTDETPDSLTYAWAFSPTSGSGSTSGVAPSRTFTAASTYNVTLTVRDQYNVASTPVVQTVTITTPPDNVAPNGIIGAPSCVGLVCSFTSTQSTDPNVGDTFTRSWNFGDNGALSTSTSPTKTYAAAGTYTVTLTLTDGWGAVSTKTVTVTVA